MREHRQHAPKTLKALTSAVSVLLGAKHKGMSASQFIDQTQKTGFVTVSGTTVG